jgi:hypothetical protein
MPPSFWLRFKRKLAGFQPEFQTYAEYQRFEALPTIPYRTESRFPHRWKPGYYSVVTEKMLYNRRKVRTLLRQDSALRKLLGKGRYLVEVLTREGRLMIAVYPIYWKARDYSADPVQVSVDLKPAYHTKAEARGCFRFVYNDHEPYGELSNGYDFFVATQNNNPLFPRLHPLFVYTPSEAQ